MRILLTSQVFPPELHPTAVMVRELATRLVDEGWDVTVATGFPHHPYGRLYPGYSKRPFQVERDGGISVRRAWHITSPRRNVSIRAGVFVTQAIGSALVGALQKRVDVVLVYGPPLVGPLLGAAVARAHRAGLATVIYDIYPDIAIETGKVSNAGVIALARIAERAQYRYSDRVIVLSEGFRRRLEDRGVDPRALRVIPVWLDPDEIRPVERDNEWRRALGIAPNVKVVLYAGTIGVISGAEIVVDAAAKLRNRTDILFLFVGEGEAKALVQERALRHGLRNLRLLPFQPRERLPEVQASADIGLVTLQPGRGHTSVPSKVVAYMAAGRPVVASVDDDCDTAELIREEGCGLVVPAANGVALAEAIALLCDAAETRAAMGHKGRQAFERRFSREACLTAYVHVLEELAMVGRRRHANR